MLNESRDALHGKHHLPFLFPLSLRGRYTDLCCPHRCHRCSWAKVLGSFIAPSKHSRDAMAAQQQDGHMPVHTHTCPLHI